MALNDVTFIKGQGGLGRPLAGEDHISGMVFYSNTLPSGFSSSDRIKTIYSLEEAEALGIAGDYSHEGTITGGTITIGSTISIGATFEVKILSTLSLGSATATVTNDANALATLVRAAINAKTAEHGFTASGSAAAVTLTAPRGYGNTINTSISVVSSGVTGTSISNFAGGADDPYIVMWYHIKEFFRIQPKGVLYLGIFSVPGGSYTFDEVSTLQNFSGGIVRQVGVYTTIPFATTEVDTLQAEALLLAADHKPLSIIYAADVSDIDGLPTLKNGDDNYVSVVIGQDGNGFGNTLYNYTEKSITSLGATLGAISRSKVSENIGWVKTFNLAENELDVINFADGTPYRTVTENELDTLNTKRYIFLRKHIGINGTYFNDSHTAISETSDYATIENNRTIDKAIRNIRTFLIPELNGPLFVNPDGTLSEDTVAYFQNLASRPLEQMQRDSELSAFEVIVNPAQNVLSTSTLTVVVKLVPVGVARHIVVNIGFTVNIS